MDKNILRRGREYYVELETLDGEAYEYQMCMRQSIDLFLPMIREQIDQRDVLLYNITGCTTFVDVWENMWIKEKQLIHIVESLIMAVKQTEEYLLYPDNLVIEKENIYIEKREYAAYQEYHPVEKQNIYEGKRGYQEENGRKDRDAYQTGDGGYSMRFLYVPGYQQDILKQISIFLEEVLERVDKNDTRAVMLAWRVHVLLKEKRLDWRKFEACIFSEENMQILDQNQKHDRGWEEKGHLPQGREELSHNNTERGRWILWIQGFLELLLLLVEGYLIYHIYAGGILEWKRNALVGNSILLAVNAAAWWAFYKRQREEKRLKELFHKEIDQEEPGFAALGQENLKFSTLGQENLKFSTLRQENPEFSTLKHKNRELTTLLQEVGGQGNPRLCDVNGKQADINICSPSLIIGKSRKDVDYCIDQSVISRRHAKITKKNDRYYIEDMASTNGTYLNEKRLKSGIFYEMREGDRIRLADVEYVFCLL